MENNFTYSVLLLSGSEQTMHNCINISGEIDIKFIKTTSMMDALDYLMDFTIDIIFLDLSIGKEEALQFLTHLSNDYENKFTPIVVLAHSKKSQSFLEKTLDYNIISIISNKDWNKQVLRLLNYLRISKLNLYVIQDSLIESEDRGTMDQLTGAYNRYGCEDIFQTLTARVKAYKEPFSAIMIDIDYFKAVNDTYGHNLGDEVLQSLSRILMNSIRRSDSLIRLGGEEFIIFLSNVNISIAKENAEKMREKIEMALHSSQALKITASFGVVQYQTDEEMDKLIKRADELLYIAKESGRNQVVWQDSTTT